MSISRPKFKHCVWRGVNKVYDEKQTVPTIKHGGGSLMF